MNTIILPIILFLVLGLVAGIALTVASKVFAVEVDERIEKIEATLSGANCGGCGYSGCSAYAKAIVEDNAPTNLCSAGGEVASKAIADIMGVSAEAVEKKYACVMCSGDCDSSPHKFETDGITSCAENARFYGSHKGCASGCVGLGDCASVCDQNAITVKNGVAHIDKNKCIACGKCVKACPKGLIKMRPEKQKVDVVCSSKDDGKTTRLSCKNGCIACKMCIKACPFEAISIVDNHAVIDYSKCKGCKKCVSACKFGRIKEVV